MDSDGATDYRMPPVWEYGNANSGLYRTFDNLSRDLGRIVRFVAVDLLFTTSPLYKPMISPPEVPSSVDVDLNVYQADPTVDGRAYLNGPYVASRLTGLQPLTQFTAEVNSEPFTSRGASVYQCFLADVSCFAAACSASLLVICSSSTRIRSTASSTATPTTKCPCSCTTRRTR